MLEHNTRSAYREVIQWEQVNLEEINPFQSMTQFYVEKNFQASDVKNIFFLQENIQTVREKTRTRRLNGEIETTLSTGNTLLLHRRLGVEG